MSQKQLFSLQRWLFPMNWEPPTRKTPTQFPGRNPSIPLTACSQTALLKAFPPPFLWQEARSVSCISLATEGIHKNERKTRLIIVLQSFPVFRKKYACKTWTDQEVFYLQIIGSKPLSVNSHLKFISIQKPLDIICVYKLWHTISCRGEKYLRNIYKKKTWHYIVAK